MDIDFKSFELDDSITYSLLLNPRSMFYIFAADLELLYEEILTLAKKNRSYPVPSS